MEIEGRALLAIVGMAAVTYLTRITGLWLVGRIDPSPRMEAWLRQVPGAVLASLIAPAVIAGGAIEAVSALAAMLVAARGGNILLAMVTGVGVVIILRGVF